MTKPESLNISKASEKKDIENKTNQNPFVYK